MLVYQMVSYKCVDHSELVALRIAMAWRTHFDSDGDAELDFKDIHPNREFNGVIHGRFLGDSGGNLGTYAIYAIKWDKNNGNPEKKNLRYT